MLIPVSGQRTHVATCGALRQPDTPALLLIHGAANDADAWLDVARPLATAGIATFAPDLPGHGRSAGTPLASIEALADWIGLLAGELGLTRVVLAGHSMGSLVALAAAARHPQLVSRLALLGSTVPMPVSATLLEAARRTPDVACRMVVAWSHTPAFYRTGGGGHGVWGAGKSLAVMRRNAATLATDLANCNAWLDGPEAAAAVTCPTLLIAGRRDRMTPARAMAPLQEALRLPTRVDLDDCGHAMMVERPAAVAAALASFCTQG